MQESKVCSRYAVLPAASSLTFEAKSSLHAVRGAATDFSGFITAVWNDDGTLVIAPPPAMHVEFSTGRARTYEVPQVSVRINFSAGAT